LRRSLAAIADELALELPSYITGYGITDASPTGGSYRAAEPGPPPVPARGQEWPVAVRDRTVHADSLPLSALLSKVLAQFTLDYEGERLGALAWASLFLRHLPDQGISLACARTLDGSLGNGKSGPERHLCVVIEPGKPSDGERMVYPTPKSRRARDAYPALVTTIEERWRDRYGAAATELRAALEAIDAQLPPGIADYPDTNSWLLGHLVRANWMIRDATQRPGCLPWHAGQRQRARPAAHL